MRTAKVYVNGVDAGVLTELILGKEYRFEYMQGFDGPEISRTMPVAQRMYHFDEFPPFFEGLLPEGTQLEGLLKSRKIDRNDLFSQLLAVGNEMVGVVTVKEVIE